MKAQQQKYKSFGQALDALARQNRDAKTKKGKKVDIPAGQKEKFATVFSIGGAIREAVAMAKGGKDLKGTTAGDNGAFAGKADGGMLRMKQ